MAVNGQKCFVYLDDGILDRFSACVANSMRRSVTSEGIVSNKVKSSLEQRLGFVIYTLQHVFRILQAKWAKFKSSLQFNFIPWFYLLPFPWSGVDRVHISIVSRYQL